MYFILQLEYIYKNCSKTFAISILVFDNPSLCSDLYVIDIFQINLTLSVYTTFSDMAAMGKGQVN